MNRNSQTLLHRTQSEPDGRGCPMSHANRSGDSCEELRLPRRPQARRLDDMRRCSSSSAYQLEAFSGTSLLVGTYPGPTDPAVVGFDPRDGAILWTSPLRDLAYKSRRGLAQPLLCTLGAARAERRVIAANPSELVACSYSGESLWRITSEGLAFGNPDMGSPTSLNMLQTGEVVAATKNGWLVRVDPVDGAVIGSFRLLAPTDVPRQTLGEPPAQLTPIGSSWSRTQAMHFGCGRRGRVGEHRCLPHRADAGRRPAQRVDREAHCPERPRTLILRSGGSRVLAEVTSGEEAKTALLAGCAGLVARGDEAGGRVGEETACILTQRLVRLGRPVWVNGGTGVHSAAAAGAIGAAGVVLGDQLALTRESALPDDVKSFVRRMDGGETLCLGAELGRQGRFAAPTGGPAVAEARILFDELVEASEIEGADRDLAGDRWDAYMARHLGWSLAEGRLLPLGQEAAFAASLTDEHSTVGPVIAAVQTSVSAHLDPARRLRPLAPGSACARAQGTTYPIATDTATGRRQSSKIADTRQAGSRLSRNYSSCSH